jgi:nucleoside-diphosphate-sugar epimerase
VLEHGRREVYNVGRDDRPLTMLELARKCCDLAGAPHALIEEVEAPARQTVVKRLSTERLRHELGWRPTLELDEGLPLVYEWVMRFPMAKQRRPDDAIRSDRNPDRGAVHGPADAQRRGRV